MRSWVPGSSLPCQFTQFHKAESAVAHIWVTDIFIQAWQQRERETWVSCFIPLPSGEGQCLIPCEWSHSGRLSSRAVFRQRSGLLLIRHRLTQKAGTQHSSQLQQNGLFLAISRGWPFPQSPSTPIFPSSQQSQWYTMTYLIVANQFLLSWTISSHSQASMVGSSCWWACLLLKTAAASLRSWRETQNKAAFLTKMGVGAEVGKGKTWAGGSHRKETQDCRSGQGTGTSKHLNWSSEIS